MRTKTFDGLDGGETGDPRTIGASEVRGLGPSKAHKADSTDWQQRLVELWQENGYGDEPPRCMGEFVDVLEKALR